MAEEEGNIPQEENVQESKPKKDCYVVTEHIKPLLDCCEEYEQGKIDDATFFARTLTKTGEFMESVKKSREAKPSE